MNGYTCNYIKDPNNDVEITFYHGQTQTHVKLCYNNQTLKPWIDLDLIRTMLNYVITTKH